MPPVEFKDYYKTLGVPKTATAEEIKKAYRKLARQYHPDVNKKPEAEKRFKELNEANEVLADPEKRKRYDQLGPDWARYASGSGFPGGNGAGGNGRTQWTYAGTPGGANPFGEDAGFSDFFRTIFGEGFESQPRRGARSRARAGGDAEHLVEVSLPEACNGAGRTLELRAEDGKTRTLEVRIPAGVRDGQRIRLAGQGGPGQGGGPNGDLYLKVSVRPHPFFTRDGDDLRAELPVALHEALLGAEVTVPTLKGRVSLRIPPETQNGRTIRLAGQGLPRAGGGSGDLFVTVKVVLPTKLTERERELAAVFAERGDDVRSHLL
ncbi:MAG: J domain-containing protein [Candidatus Limnocylindrales bacterium]